MKTNENQNEHTWENAVKEHPMDFYEALTNVLLIAINSDEEDLITKNDIDLCHIQLRHLKEMHGLNQKN